jgi:ribosomal protein S18 acetylase RimI-like enzyme
MAMLHVDEDNEPAVRVYRRIGYRVVRVEDWLASSPS